MKEYEICTDFFEIVTGSPSKLTKAYTEAAKAVSESTPQSLAYLQNFITSIEAIASKDAVKDTRISSTKGNIKTFQGYDNIKTAIDFLQKNLGSIDLIKDLISIHKALEDNQSEYIDGYNKNNRLIILEYDSALYLLVTGLSMGIANNIDVVQNGMTIKVKKKAGKTMGTIEKAISEMAKQLSAAQHKDYLKGLLEAQENRPVGKVTESMTFLEGTIADTIDMFDDMFKGIGKIGNFGKRIFLAVKNSVFGIVPLIRSVCYLRYKKKADTILALDQQCEFIRRNIEQLQRRTNIDEATKAEIIKKQEAYITAYQKKAEKLRVELCEGEKEAAAAAKKDEPKVANTKSSNNGNSSSSGELVLEDGTIWSLNGGKSDDQ